MKRHSRASGNPARSRRPKSSKSKSRNPTKVAGHRPSRGGAETEVARLKRELHEALEQQTATSEVLQVISSSPGDLAAGVCGHAGESRHASATPSLEISTAGMATPLHLVATHNTPPAFAEARRRCTSFVPIRIVPIGRMISNQNGGSRRRCCGRREPTLSNVIRRSLQPSNLAASGRFCCADAEGERTDRCVQPVPPRSSSLHRQADRTGHELRRPGRHRHRERAAAQRTAPAHDDLPSEQQTATSEVLQVISAALPAILSRCLRPCWRSRSHLRRQVWKHLPLGRRRSWISLPRTIRRLRSLKLRRRSPLQPDPDRSYRSHGCCQSGGSHRRSCGRTSVTLRSAIQYVVAAVELGGVRTGSAVPMLKENELIGAFIVITARKFVPSPTSRSSWCRTSPLRPSSPSRTRGC